MHGPFMDLNMFFIIFLQPGRPKTDYIFELCSLSFKSPNVIETS